MAEQKLPKLQESAVFRQARCKTPLISGVSIQYLSETA